MRRGFLALVAGLGAMLSGACSPLTAFNALAPRDPARQPGRDIPYASDPRQRLDVYVPQVPPAHPAPVLLFFYGGNWDSGKRQDYAWVGHSLAAQGFVVIVPDYRLVPQVRYPAFVQDGALAVRWAHDHAADYGGDPNRILLSGHSAGAYIALQLAMDDAFLRVAGVDPKLIKGVAGLSGPYAFYPFDAPASREAFGQWPAPQDTQPINHVGPGRPATFLAHGEKDQYVEVANTLKLGEALMGAGDSVGVKIYSGVDHPGLILALSRPFRGKAPVLADMTKFLKAAAN